MRPTSAPRPWSALASALPASLLLLAAPPTAPAADGRPATVAEAAAVLDLSALPRLGGDADGAPAPRQRSLASLTYEAAGSVPDAFAFHGKQLIERGWAEAPGGAVTDAYASGTFICDGFTVSALVAAGSKPGTVNVTLTNLGNVAPASLPRPAGAKELYAGPASASYVSEATPEAVAADVAAALEAAGWSPYGKAGQSLAFKQNAILLNAQIAPAPAQGGKTAVSYTTALLSADLPAPPDAEGIRFADVTTTLSFETAATIDDLAGFYRRALAPLGWQALSERPSTSGPKHEQLFRNEAGDLLILEVREAAGRRRVQLRQRRADEIAALREKAEAAGKP